MRQPNFGPPRERAQAGFQKVDKEKRATLLRMSSFVFKHYKWAIMVVMACVVISSLTSLVSSLFTKTLIDDYVVPLTQVDNPEYQSLAQTLFVIGLILFFGTVCSYTYNRLMIYISQGTMLHLRKTIFEKMQHLPISYFDQRSHGDIMSVYTNDVHGSGNDDCHHSTRQAVTWLFPHAAAMPGTCQRLHRGDDDRSEGRQDILS